MCKLQNAAIVLSATVSLTGARSITPSSITQWMLARTDTHTHPPHTHTCVYFGPCRDFPFFTVWSGHLNYRVTALKFI